jgi:hypothetical protein
MAVARSALLQEESAAAFAPLKRCGGKCAAVVNPATRPTDDQLLDGLHNKRGTLCCQLEPPRTRTGDPQLKRLMLCQLS